MGVEFKTISLGLQDIELTPRFRDDDKYIDIEHFKVKPYYVVQKDTHGEYTFTHENLQLTREPHQEFYDGADKILESWYDEQKQSIVIHVLTKIQTNLFVDVNSDECTINAKGALCIDGQFNIKSILDISADNLCLLDTIECEGSVVLKAEQAVYLSSSIKSNIASIDTAYLLQAGNVQVEKQYDVSVQAFQQPLGYKTQAGSLRLVSQQCELAGDLHVKEKCFLVANALTIGHFENGPSNIYLPENHHVHVISAVIQGDTYVSTPENFSDTNKEAKFICDGVLLIDSSSTLEFKNSSFDLNQIKNAGHLYIDECDALINDFIQNGFFETSYSDFHVTGTFSHESNDASIIKQSTFFSQSTTVKEGIFQLNNSEWTGDKVFVESGLVQVETNSDICLQESFITDEAASLKMVDSHLRVKDSLLLYGSSTLNNSNIKSNILCSDKNTLNSTQSTITAFTNASLNGNLDIKESTIHSENIQISGCIHVDDSMLYAEHIKYDVQQAVIKNSIASADMISIEGSDLPENVTFFEGSLSAKTIRVLNQVVLKNVSLIGIDDANMCHDIQGKLIMKDSEFITESDIHHLGKHLELLGTSRILANRIDSTGPITAHTSAVHCNDFTHDGSLLDLDASKINVKNKFWTSKTNINIDKESSLSASDVVLGHDTHLRLTGNSVLLASHQGVTHASASIDSDQSTIIVQKFVPLGRVELCSSLLSAKELLIYNKFNAYDASEIHVEEKISLAKTANVHLETSVMRAAAVDTSGQMHVENSHILARDTIFFGTDSNTKLQGVTQITAHDAVVRGKLVTEKDVVEETTIEEATKKKPKPTLKIAETLHVSPMAEISGTEDLLLGADAINFMGAVNLEAHLCAKGRVFDNSGSVTTLSTYLGFDDAVINRGMLSSKSMVVHSNFFNILGRAYTQESLACSGGMSINMGLIAANNYTNDSFLSLSAGLVLPNFSANPEYICSKSNLIAVGKTAATVIAPTYSSGIQLLGMIPGLYYSAKNMYKMYNELGVESLTTMRRHEYMPLLCQAKSVFMLGQGLYHSGNAFGADLKTWGESCSDFVDDPSKVTNWGEIGSCAAGAFAGSYTDNSLLHINAGVSFVANTSKTNFIHVNMGVEQSLLSHSINTTNLYNSGSSAGREANFSAGYIKNTGTLEGTTRYVLRADKIDNGITGKLKGRGANVDVKKMQQAGHMDIANGRVKIDRFVDTVGAHTQIADAALKGSDFDQHGTTSFKNVYVEESDHFITHEGSEENNNNVSVKTKNYEHHGKMAYENRMIITAETGVFAKGAEVSGHTTDADKLWVEKSVDEKTESDLNQASEKEFKPQDILSLNVDHLTLDHKARGGDYTQIKGAAEDLVQDDGTTETAKCKQLTIGESADIDLEHGSIAAINGDVASERLVLDGFHVAIKEGTFQQSSVVKLKNSSYVGERLIEDGTGVLEHTNVELKQLNQHGTLNTETASLKIDAFVDDEKAHTNLTNTALQGSDFDQHGTTHFENVYVKESDHFITHEGSKENNNNVSVTTKNYEHHGTMAYENRMTITAETGLFSKGAEVSGHTTDIDKLWVEDDVNQASEKEFKPQDILSLNIDNLALNHKARGGDYTQIKGAADDVVQDNGTTETAKCKQLTIGESADIDLKYGSITAIKGDVSSEKLVLDSFHLDIEQGVFQDDSKVALVNSTYTGEKLTEEGSLKLENSHLGVTQVDLMQQADEQLLNSSITAQTIVDQSQMSYQGQSGVITNHYKHTGHVEKIEQPVGSEEPNAFFVDAKTAELDGSTALDHGYYSIEHMLDGTKFAAGTGRYSLYMAGESLSFTTKDSFHLNDSIQRQCDVSVQAADVLYGGTYNQKNDLTFISTSGDVKLTSKIQSRNLFVKSAGDIYTNNAIDTDSALSFEAEGTYYNYGGTLNGYDVGVKASEIKNFTPASVGAGTRLPMGSSGIISARNHLLLQATQGNIENHGGILHAGNYAQLLAARDVLNLCNIKTIQGSYDTLKQFDGGLISGGTGKDTDGVGLYIKADGQVISDASDFVSSGSNYIEGVNGVQFTARSHTAITQDDTTETWYGKKKHIIGTSTVVKGCGIQSINGRNIIQSGEGSVTSIASQFVSPGGTDIYAKGNVNLFGLKTQDRTIVSKSYAWGLSKKDFDSIHENSTPTLFYDHGATRIQSAEGSVDARGAYFVGSGDLSVKAGKQILFGVDILEHSVTEKSNLFSVSGPGFGAWEAIKNGGNVWDAVTAEDVTLAKMKSLSDSNNNTELLANAFNLGLDLCNTSNSILRGFTATGVSEELLARYGLGGADGIAPSVTVSMTQSKTKSTWQTQSQGGVDRGGNVTLEAGEAVILENGVRVHADGNTDVDTPDVIGHAAGLNSTVDQKTVTESMGVSLLGQVQSVGASYSRTQTKSTTYVNSELSSGGNITMHHKDQAMHQVDLEGANIDAKTLDMNTDSLIIKDKQDTSTTKTQSYSLNTNGQFSIHVGKDCDRVTNQSSGIHVRDGINVDGHKVHAGELYMEGGKIITEGKNEFEADKVESHALEDERHHIGIGLSGNVSDVNRLTGQKSTNMAGEQTFATMAVSVDHVDYKAVQHSVIHGEAATALDIGLALGDAVHTTSSDGKIVQKDQAMNLHVDVPLTNEEYLKTYGQNIQAGNKKLKDMLLPKQNHQEPVAFDRAEGLKPREDDPSELSHEEQDALNEAMANLQFESPEQAQELQHYAEKATQEISENGQVSPKTKNRLKDGMIKALLTTLQYGSEEKWAKLLEKMGPEYKQSLIKLLSKPETREHAGIKVAMGVKGLVISFFYNAALSSIDSEIQKKDIVKHATILTGVEVAFGFVFELPYLNVFSGPVSAARFLLSIADCFYNETKTSELSKSGVAHLDEAQKLAQEGHSLDAWAMRQLAAEQQGTAARAQAGHALAEITTPIVKAVEGRWNEYRNKQKDFKKIPEVKPVTVSALGIHSRKSARESDDIPIQQHGPR
jgi:hypothetical protein